MAALIETVFDLSTNGKLDLSLSRVELGTVTDEVLDC